MQVALFRSLLCGIAFGIALNSAPASAKIHVLGEPVACATSQPGLPPMVGDHEKTATRVIDLVPHGWVLMDKADGDLNYDSKFDSVLIIARNDPKRQIHIGEGPDETYYDCNRRAMLVALQQDDGKYAIVAADDQIIPLWSHPSLGDPYEGLSIARRAMHLEINFWPMTGSPSKYNRIFRFRWSGDAMHLIGFDQKQIHRESGKIQKASLNYLINRRKDMAGFVTDITEDWQHSNIPEKPLLEMSEIGDGFAFQP